MAIASTQLQAEPLAYRRKVYWCAPDGVAFDHLKPTEYFGFIAGLYPQFNADAIAPLVSALELQPFLKQSIGKLSTGTQKKVALITAMVVGTPVVLLDEPLAALDSSAVAVVRGQLATAATQKDRVWIVTSHESLGEPAEAQSQTLSLPLRNAP